MSVPSRFWVGFVAVAGVMLCVVALLWPLSGERDYGPETVDTWSTLGGEDPLTVAVGIWPGLETLVLAREKGLLSERTMNFVEMPWTSAALAAFENRVVDVAVLSSDELLRLEAAGHHPKAILVLGISRGSDAILATREIGTLKDLRGKRVAIEMTASGEYLLAKALRSVGMNMGDVKIVPISIAESEGSFEEGDFDAVVAKDPWRSRLLAKGAHVLFDSSQVGNELCRFLVVRDGVMSQFSAELQQLVDAHFKMRTTLLTPASWGEEMEPILRREGLTREQLAASLALIPSPDLQQSRVFLDAGPDNLSVVLRKVASFMEAEGMLSRHVDVSKLLDSHFIDKRR